MFCFRIVKRSPYNPVMPNPIAELIGFAYAHLQHGIDRAVDWGFRRMREAGEQEPKARKTQAASKAARAAKSAIRFLGQTGEAYFRTYEELKRSQAGRSKDRS